MQGQKTNLTKLTLMKVFKHGMSMFISAIALLGLLVIVNYIVAARTHYTDFTNTKINTLTDESRQLLADIDFPVSIKAFYVTRSQTRIALLLDEYRHLNDNIDFELIDPLKNPVIANEYDVTEPSTIIFEAKGSRMKLKPPPQGAINSELEITMMLYRMVGNNTSTVYFLAGHGELSIENPNQDGLSSAAELLRQQGYQVESLNLATVDEIPTDGTLLIIAEPKTVFDEIDYEKINTYYIHGGNFLLLSAPGSENNLLPITSRFGLVYGDNYIYETSSDNTTEYGPTAPLCKPYEPSEIIEGLENQNFMFPLARSVDLISESQDIVYTRLMASSPESWAESDIESLLGGSSGVRPTRDESEQRGPVVVAYALDAHVITPDSLLFGSYLEADSRAAVFGNARFATNRFVSQFPSNLQLFQHTVNWLTRNERVMNITPHAMMYTPVELRRSQRNLLFWITLVIYPGIIVLVGIVVWIRKR